MRAWGTKLYQDDIACEVRDDYKKKLREGKSNKQVTEEIFAEYIDIIEDEDDSAIFWFALADTQWSFGRLLPEVKEKALEFLGNGGEVQRWIDDRNIKGAEARRKILEDLKQKLNSSQPPEKKFSIPRIYKCEWKMGDVFAYKLESNIAEQKGLWGRYLLLQKVDERRWYPGHTIPIVRARISDSTDLPSLQNSNSLEYIK